MRKKHHYVPRFYLKGFRDPVNPRCLWVADKKDLLVRKESPSRAARISGYYDLTKVTFAKSSMFEDFLSKIEARAASVFYKIQDQDLRITLEDRYHLSNYLGLQLGRVPAFRQVIKDALTSNANRAIRENVLDNDKMRARFGDEASFFKEYFLAGKLEPVPGTDYLLASTFEFGLYAAEHIFEKRWMFLKNSGKQSFFTSDNPVGLLTPDAKPPRGQVPFRDKRLEISFAVSPSIAILMHSHDEHEDIIEVDDATVIDMNRRVLPTVERFVYAAGQSQVEWVRDQWNSAV